MLADLASFIATTDTITLVAYALIPVTIIAPIAIIATDRAEY